LPHAKSVAYHALIFNLHYDDVGELLNEAAAFLRLRADFEGSMQMHSQSLALRRRCLPETHIAIADSLNDTACLYGDLYRLSQAETMFDQALAIRRASAADADVDSLLVYLNNAGLTKARLGKCAEAEVLLTEAAARCADPVEAEPFIQAVVFNSLAELELRQGKLDSALTNAERALAIREAVGNPEKTARTYFTLGEIYRRRKDVAAAQAAFEEGLELKRQVHGARHPELIPILRRYARLAREIGDEEKRESLEVEAEQIRLRFHLPRYSESDCKSG
jgi:tetratricopeptide (TPR) repeat protein